MQLLGLPILEELKRKHPDCRGQLDAWRSEVERAQWADSQEIKEKYSTASFLADNRVIFNIKGNHYRLVVKVRYQGGIVLVEWGGTHAEYNKKRF